MFQFVYVNPNENVKEALNKEIVVHYSLVNYILFQLVTFLDYSLNKNNMTR